jgi:hypothetical protein
MRNRPDAETERYLARIAARLRLMPEDRREAEIEEARAHLAELIETSREAGTPESKAVAAALAQFGSPRRLGDQLMRAWYRANPKMLPGTPWSVVGWSIVFFFAAQWSMLAAHYGVRTLWNAGGDRLNPGPADLFTSVLSVSACVASSYLIGRFAPRRYLAGVLLMIGLDVASVLAYVTCHVPASDLPPLQVLPGPVWSMLVLHVPERLIGAYMGRTDHLRRWRRKTLAMRANAG